MISGFIVMAHARDVKDSGQQMLWNTLNAAEIGLKRPVAAALRPVAGKRWNAATAGRRERAACTAMKHWRHA
jgi:hypothetical protein